VFRTFERMYEVFERDRELIPSGQFSEVRYEDLVKHPMEEMQRLYDELQLDEFDLARPGIEKYLAEQKDYKTNRYQTAPELESQIARRWGGYLAKYGYERAPVARRNDPVRVG
jgi:hypothetical protein